MSDDLERIIRPIVEGQICSFLNDHPEVLSATNWYKGKRNSKEKTFVKSIAKRILGDLLCPENRMRLENAFLESFKMGGLETQDKKSSMSSGHVGDTPRLAAATGRGDKTRMGFPGWFPTAVLFSMIIFPLLVRLCQ